MGLRSPGGEASPHPERAGSPRPTSEVSGVGRSVRPCRRRWAVGNHPASFEQLINPGVRELAAGHRRDDFGLGGGAVAEPPEDVFGRLARHDHNPVQVADDHVAGVHDDAPQRDRMVYLPRPAVKGANRGGAAGEHREVAKAARAELRTRAGRDTVPGSPAVQSSGDEAQPASDKEDCENKTRHRSDFLSSSLTGSRDHDRRRPPRTSRCILASIERSLFEKRRGSRHSPIHSGYLDRITTSRRRSRTWCLTASLAHSLARRERPHRNTARPVIEHDRHIRDRRCSVRDCRYQCRDLSNPCRRSQGAHQQRFRRRRDARADLNLVTALSNVHLLRRWPRNDGGSFPRRDEPHRRQQQTRQQRVLANS